MFRFVCLFLLACGLLAALAPPVQARPHLLRRSAKAVGRSAKAVGRVATAPIRFVRNRHGN